MRPPRGAPDQPSTIADQARQNDRGPNSQRITLADRDWSLGRPAGAFAAGGLASRLASLGDWPAASGFAAGAVGCRARQAALAGNGRFGRSSRAAGATAAASMRRRCLCYLGGQGRRAGAGWALGLVPLSREVGFAGKDDRVALVENPKTLRGDVARRPMPGYRVVALGGVGGDIDMRALFVTKRVPFSWIRLTSPNRSSSCACD